MTTLHLRTTLFISFALIALNGDVFAQSASIDKKGYPLPHARIELVGREVAYADAEGRFLIRLSVNETWPLKAADTGFREVTQQVSGADAASVVISLEYLGTTGVADQERFGGCDCHGYLFPYGER